MCVCVCLCVNVCVSVCVCVCVCVSARTKNRVKRIAFTSHPNIKVMIQNLCVSMVTLIVYRVPLPVFINSTNSFGFLKKTEVYKQTLYIM